MLDLIYQVSGANWNIVFGLDIETFLKATLDDNLFDRMFSKVAAASLAQLVSTILKTEISLHVCRKLPVVFFLKNYSPLRNSSLNKATELYEMNFVTN